MHLNLHRITSKIVTLGKCGRITCARKLFDEMPHRDAVAWNAMLSSYSQLGNHREALSLFHRMRISNTKPDHFSFTATLSACAGLNNLQNGAKIHALVIIFGYRCSLPVNNSLIDMYGKCFEPCSANKVFQETNEKNEVTWCSLLFAYTNTGQFNMANEVFHTMPKRVTISWNIMIVGHAKYGEIELCLSLFREMRETSCAPDQWTLSALMNACGELSEMSYDFTFGAVLHACSGLAVLGHGRMVHGCVIYYGFHAHVYVGNGLVNMYAKCGDIEGSSLAFSEILDKDLVSWNAMLFGFGMHGLATQALQLYDHMVASGQNQIKLPSLA
ncbi:hypothetical protein LWI29_002952 [Acer saccharum]|uniref:Pentatricopeptide repeat-containing protein n=1 Tax=Acer saccharum TaxID=4024 RepID=A0AA39TMB2_ACESA|nr:hypothetical protein LWI29_002952 [Acer saccharum]